MPSENNFFKLLQQGVEKELPSGLIVRVRPIDSGQLLTDKRIPDSLMRVVQKQLVGIQENKDQEEVAQQIESELKAEMKDNVQTTIDLYEDIRLFGEAVAIHSVVYPKIVVELKEGQVLEDNEMLLSWFPTDDLIAFGQLVGVPLKDLQSFRFRKNTDVESVQSSKSDLPNTGQSLWDEPVSEESVSEEGDVASGTPDSSADDPLPVQQRSGSVRRIRREQTQ